MPLLLKVLGLRVEFVESPRKRIHAVNGVSFDVCHGEVLGILGESGSGKSTIAKASLRLLPKNAEIIEGVIEFEGRALIRLKEHEMESLRGTRMAMIPSRAELGFESSNESRRPDCGGDSSAPRLDSETVPRGSRHSSRAHAPEQFW
jgi:ABC-type glutathione transport system ATPase component